MKVSGRWRECVWSVNITKKVFNRDERKNSVMLAEERKKKWLRVKDVTVSCQHGWRRSGDDWKQCSDSLLAQVGPSQPGGHWHSNPVGTSWHVPPLAQGLETQACSADGGRGWRSKKKRNKTLLFVLTHSDYRFCFLQEMFFNHFHCIVQYIASPTAGMFSSQTCSDNSLLS